MGGWAGYGESALGEGEGAGCAGGACAGTCEVGAGGAAAAGDGVLVAGPGPGVGPAVAIQVFRFLLLRPRRQMLPVDSSLPAQNPIAQRRSSMLETYMSALTHEHRWRARSSSSNSQPRHNSIARSKLKRNTLDRESCDANHHLQVSR